MGAAGKVASAALTVAAPEAKVAKVAAGAAASRGKAKPAAARRGRRPITPGMSPAQVDDELQARRTDAAAGKPGTDPVNAAAGVEPEQPASPPPASPGGGPSMPGMPAAAATGSGFLLGVFAWALGLAYLRGGSAEVKRFLKAKFLNQTEAGA